MENVELKSDLNPQYYVYTSMHNNHTEMYAIISLLKCELCTGVYATETHWSIRIRSVLHYNLLAVVPNFIDESVQPNNVHFFSFPFIFCLTKINIQIDLLVHQCWMRKNYNRFGIRIPMTHGNVVHIQIMNASKMRDFVMDV